MARYVVAQFETRQDAQQCRQELTTLEEMPDLRSRFFGDELLIWDRERVSFDVFSIIRKNRGVVVARWLEVLTAAVLVKRQPGDGMALDDVAAFLATRSSRGFRRRSAYGVRCVMSIDDLLQLETLLVNGNLDFQLELNPDESRFDAVIYASCPECGSRRLDFLAREHFELPADQLVCHECGGMFPLTFA